MEYFEQPKQEQNVLRKITGALCAKVVEKLELFCQLLDPDPPE